MRIIRLARTSDLPALSALYALCRREAPWLAEARRAQANFVADSLGETVVAEFIETAAGSEPCGLVSFQREAGFIHHLYVHPERRGQGTGARLLAALHGRLPLPWQLRCLLSNVHARRFYDRGGWVELEVDADDRGTGEGPHALLELRQAPRLG